MCRFRSLEVCAFLHIFLKHSSAKTAIVIVPVNVLDNWVSEFKKWITPPDKQVVYSINDAVKTFDARSGVLQKWHGGGGVLVIGYEMFRNLIQPTKKEGDREFKRRRAKGEKEVIDLEDEEDVEEKQALNRRILSSADLVVCDEGHRIKNKDAAISLVLKKVKTKRRLVLTGYPLQNNLVEYWCMVDFVRPAYLGTLGEFENMFNQPILNGQCIDSKPEDIKLMRERAYILHKQLEGFIQRRGHKVLEASLPKKFEYIMPIRLSPIQEKLYEELLRVRGGGEGSEGFGSGNIFKTYAAATKIWNHPDVLHNVLEHNATAEPGEELQTVDVSWAAPVMAGYLANNIENSYKLKITLGIVDMSVSTGNKVLIFSQNLQTLDTLEALLGAINVPGRAERWAKNVSYFRLDGSTCSADRQKMINKFNAAKNKRCHVFLLSTKAGSLGINLIGANRVIVLDSSWNPCHDAQAVCRVYRYGQQKPCFIYRMVASGTMENKIYDRQIHKMGLASRVVDTESTERIFTEDDLRSLFIYKPPLPEFDVEDPSGAADPVMAVLCGQPQYRMCFGQPPKNHDSLLAPDVAESLSKEQQTAALKSYAKTKLDKERGYQSSQYGVGSTSQRGAGSMYAQQPLYRDSASAPQYGQQFRMNAHLESGAGVGSGYLPSSGAPAPAGTASYNLQQRQLQHQGHGPSPMQVEMKKLMQELYMNMNPQQKVRYDAMLPNQRQQILLQYQSKRNQFIVANLAKARQQHALKQRIDLLQRQSTRSPPEEQELLMLMQQPQPQPQPQPQQQPQQQQQQQQLQPQQQQGLHSHQHQRLLLLQQRQQAQMQQAQMQQATQQAHMQYQAQQQPSVYSAYPEHQQQMIPEQQQRGMQERQGHAAALPQQGEPPQQQQHWQPPPLVGGPVSSMSSMTALPAAQAVVPAIANGAALSGIGLSPTLLYAANGAPTPGQGQPAGQPALDAFDPLATARKGPQQHPLMRSKPA